MARRKNSTPQKQHLTLTVSLETRALLGYISGATGRSISALVAEWAEKEAKKIAKQQGKSLPPLPDSEQTKLE